jgi:adenylate cyclase
MRVYRTFAFVDLCGFSGYSDAQGEDGSVAVLAHLRTTIRAAAQRRGVRVAKWLGDGAMIAGIKPDGLVGCVLEVRDIVAADGPLPLRGGIAEGPAILFEGDDYVGAAVNVAARLSARAAPNQVLSTADVADQLVAVATLRPLEPLRAGGLSGPIEVRELLTGPGTRRQRPRNGRRVAAASRPRRP